METITVCVVFYNEQNNLPRLLRSFESEINDSDGVSFSFLFIDNSSSDLSFELVENWLRKNREKYLKPKLIKRELNHLGDARQQAVEASISEWLIFIDGDSELELNWTAGLKKALKLYSKEAVGIGGASYYVPQATWHKWVAPLASLFPLGRKSNDGSVNHVPTNNYLIKIEAVKRAGGFGSYFPRVGEDLDLNIRLRKIGKIFYTNEFSVRHFLPVSQRSWFKKMFRYGWAQSSVSIKNKGGVSVLKALPTFFILFLIVFLTQYPLVLTLTLVFIFLFSNLRFYFLTLAIYGLGEIVGLFGPLFSGGSLRSKQADPVRES